MGKDLSEMTLEELWELFPIFLVAHDNRWKDYYNEIEKTLTGLLSKQPVERIGHIGSTAIQGIWAKNIVDVMVEISQCADMKEVAHILEQNGFVKMSDENGRFHSIRDIQKKVLPIRCIISILDIQGIMMNFISVTI